MLKRKFVLNKTPHEQFERPRDVIRRKAISHKGRPGVSSTFSMFKPLTITQDLAFNRPRLVCRYLVLPFLKHVTHNSCLYAYIGNDMFVSIFAYCLLQLSITYVLACHPKYNAFLCCSIVFNTNQK